MKRILSRLLLGFSFIACAALVALRLSPKPVLLEGVAFSPVVYDRHGTLLRFGLATDDVYRQFVPLEKISPTFVESTLLYEDRYFYQHAGTNPVALAKACWNEFVHARRRLGASTITMQVARLRYHLNTRTWAGKFRQITLAARIECYYSKREILEAYFNLAPYGRNIEGIGAASRIYFGKEAADLSLTEALTMSVIPQNPAHRAPSVLGSKNEQTLLAARQILFEEWVQKHPADESKRSVLEMPLQIHTLADVPFRAPHFTEECLNHTATGPRNVVTTLDLPLQQLAEKHLAAYMEEKKRQGIVNAVALLIDYQTMDVLASVGSANYFDKEIDGQVNGTTMKRSPGSALKPFVYALALEQGIIQPHSLLKDAPTSFNGYNPENFDRDFMGPVQACDALVQSRNVPAVYLASKLKEHSLYGLLQNAGVDGLHPENTYGLTIALGGAEVSPEDMARLYAMLANRGRLQALRTTLDQKSEASKKLLAPEAAFLVLDMLKKNNLPAYQGTRARQVEAAPVAWKTGTSYSFRDAWTAGVFDHYVLVVWVGNFDGKPNPALVGRSAAAPLFFSIINAIRAQSESTSPASDTAQAPWESAEGLNLEPVDLCSVTGELANEHCPHRIKGWFIPGVSPIKTCSVHEEIFIDPRSGYRIANINDVPDARREVWEVWPSDMQVLFKYAGLPRRTPPPFAAERGGAITAVSRDGLEMTSPRQGIEYHLRLDEQNQSVPLQANAAASVQSIYWFANKTYLGSSAPGETFLWRPTPGTFQINAVDDRGASVTRSLIVAIDR